MFDRPEPSVNPEPSWVFVDSGDRAALLRDGVVVLADGVQRRKRWVTIAGPAASRATKLARARFGPRVDVTHLAEGPRRLEPLACDGYCEPDPGRLKLRYATTMSQHVDDVLCEEDETAVVVYATVCTPVHVRETHLYDAPYRIYLEAPLGDREVIDGVSGQQVRYRNVGEELARELGQRPAPPFELLDGGLDAPYDPR